MKAPVVQGLVLPSGTESTGRATRGPRIVAEYGTRGNGTTWCHAHLGALLDGLGVKGLDLPPCELLVTWRPKGRHPGPRVYELAPQGFDEDKPRLTISQGRRKGWFRYRDPDEGMRETSWKGPPSAALGVVLDVAPWRGEGQSVQLGELVTALSGVPGLLEQLVDPQRAHEVLETNPTLSLRTITEQPSPDGESEADSLRDIPDIVKIVKKLDAD